MMLDQDKVPLASGERRHGMSNRCRVASINWTLGADLRQHSFHWRRWRGQNLRTDHGTLSGFSAAHMGFARSADVRPPSRQVMVVSAPAPSYAGTLPVSIALFTGVA